MSPRIAFCVPVLRIPHSGIRVLFENVRLQRDQNSD